MLNALHIPLRILKMEIGQPIICVILYLAHCFRVVKRILRARDAVEKTPKFFA